MMVMTVLDFGIVDFQTRAGKLDSKTEGFQIPLLVAL